MAQKRRGTSKQDIPATPAFECVRSQIAYCGLWCGSCAVGNGTINELAARLEKLIRDYGVEEWGPTDLDYPALHKSLEAIGRQATCPGCLKGGGRTNCEIRSCAVGKSLKECVDCDDVGDCSNSKLLQHMRSGALRVGMVVKNVKGGRRDFLKKGEAELCNRWNCHLLFKE